MEKRNSYHPPTCLGKRALMLLLSIAMVLTMMPLLPGYVGQASAVTGEPEITAIEIYKSRYKEGDKIYSYNPTTEKWEDASGEVVATPELISGQPYYVNVKIDTKNTYGSGDSWMSISVPRGIAIADFPGAYYSKPRVGNIDTENFDELLAWDDLPAFTSDHNPVDGTIKYHLKNNKYYTEQGFAIIPDIEVFDCNPKGLNIPNALKIETGLTDTPFSNVVTMDAIETMPKGIASKLVFDRNNHKPTAEQQKDKAYAVPGKEMEVCVDNIGMEGYREYNSFLRIPIASSFEIDVTYPTGATLNKVEKFEENGYLGIYILKQATLSPPRDNGDGTTTVHAKMTFDDSDSYRAQRDWRAYFVWPSSMADTKQIVRFDNAKWTSALTGRELTMPAETAQEVAVIVDANLITGTQDIKQYNYAIDGRTDLNYPLVQFILGNDGPESSPREVNIEYDMENQATIREITLPGDLEVGTEIHYTMADGKKGTYVIPASQEAYEIGKNRCTWIIKNTDFQPGTVAGISKISFSGWSVPQEFASVGMGLDYMYGLYEFYENVDHRDGAVDKMSPFLAYGTFNTAISTDVDSKMVITGAGRQTKTCTSTCTPVTAASCYSGSPAYDFSNKDLVAGQSIALRGTMPSSVNIHHKDGTALAETHVLVNPIIYAFMPAGISYRNLKFTRNGADIPYEITAVDSPTAAAAGITITKITFTEEQQIEDFSGNESWEKHSVNIKTDIFVNGAAEIGKYDISKFFAVAPAEEYNLDVVQSEGYGVEDDYGVNGGRKMAALFKGAITVKEQKSLNITNSIADYDGNWILYDGTDATTGLFAPNHATGYKINVKNSTGVTIDKEKCQVYIPIPKKGQDLGKVFNPNGAFGFDISKAALVGTPPAGWQIEYYTVTGKADDAKKDPGTQFTGMTKTTVDDVNANMIVLSNTSFLPDAAAANGHPDGQDFLFDLHMPMDSVNAAKNLMNCVPVYTSYGSIKVSDGSQVAMEVARGGIEGFVFNDPDKDGQYDGADGETAIENVAVTITDSYGHVRKSKTDVSGRYSVYGLRSSEGVKTSVRIYNPNATFLAFYGAPTDDISLPAGGLATSPIFSNVTANGTQSVASRKDIDLFGMDQNQALVNAGLSSFTPLSFVANGGELSDPSQALIKGGPGGTIKLPTLKDRTGYTCNGWYTAPTDGTKINDQGGNFKVPPAPATYFAQWTKLTYKITYTLNGGTAASGAPSSYTIDDTVALKNPTKEGYTFAGWTGANGPAAEKDVTIPKGSTGFKNYTANWNANTYTIKFDSNEGTGTMDDMWMAYGVERNLTANTFTKKGHTFNGWNTKADGSGTAYTDKQSVNNLTTADKGEVTLYAQWSAGKYAVSFDSNTGTGDMDDLDMVYDEEKALSANTFAKEWHTFSGWNTEADGSGTAYTDEQLVKNLAESGTVTLYAQWAPYTYKVKFDNNGGMGAMLDQSMTYGEAATLTKCDFIKMGSTFTGWNTEADGSGTAYTDQQSVSNLTETNNGTVTLYAQWKQNEITIDDIPVQTYTGQPIEPTLTIKSEGRLLTPTFDYDVEYSDNIEPGTAKATVTFKGFYSGTKMVEFTIKKDTYAIKFDANTGTGTMDDLDMEYNVEKALTDNAFTKTGYTFNGWNTEADGSGTAYTDKQVVKNLVNSGTVTLYAQWTANTYKVKFEVNGGLGFMSEQPMTYDKEVALTKCGFIKIGSTFNGWNTEADGNGTAYADEAVVKNLTETNNGTVTLYARWQQNEITIDDIPVQTYTGQAIEPPLTVKSEGRLLTPTYDYDVEYSDNIDPGTAKARVTFKGYYSGTRTVEFTIKTDGSGTGGGGDDGENYIIKFDANTGTGTMADLDMEYDVEKALTANAFVKDGHKFKEWNTEADGSGTAYADEAVVKNLVKKGTVTLYAQWVTDGSGTGGDYTIKFDANTGTGTMADMVMQYDVERELSANAFTKDNHIFKEWNTEADGSGTAYTDKQVVKNLANGGTVTLYAQWTTDGAGGSGDDYAIKFDPNGGIGIMNDQLMTYDKEEALNECGFVKVGSLFDGWNTEADGSGTAYTDKQVVKNLANGGIVTLYAQWKDDGTGGGGDDGENYIIKFDANTGTGTMADLDMEYDVEKALTANAFVKDGHKFKEWNTEADGSGTTYADQEVVKNLVKKGTVTLYAQWVTDGSGTGGDDGENYIIKFDANTGTGTMAALDMEYDVEKALTANAFVKDGHKFKEWNTEADGSGTTYADEAVVKNLVKKGTVTLYAQWVTDGSGTGGDDGENYIIKFDANTGTGTMADLDMEYDVEKALTANAFVKDGHKFKEWNTEADGSGTTYADEAVVKNLVKKGTVTLYAQWVTDGSGTGGDDGENYTIKFDANTGTGTMADLDMEYDVEKALTANAFVKDGHKFKEWNTEADGSGTTYADEAVVKNLVKKGTVTLYAQWVTDGSGTGGDDGENYIIKFDANTGTGTMADLDMEYDVEKALTANAFVKDGHKFKEWNTEADGSGTTYADKEVVKNLVKKGTVTLYAQWVTDGSGTGGDDGENYIIKFDANTGTGTMADLDMEYDVEKALTANAFVKDGHKFKEWNTEADGSGTTYADKEVVKNLVKKGTVTLYAQWVTDGSGTGGDDGENYIIKFDANTGTGTMADLDMEYDVEKALTANAFVKDGHKFKEWNTEADGSGTTYADEAVVKNLVKKGTVTLYAQWVTDGSGTGGDDGENYIIKFDANTGTGTMADLDMEYDVEKALTANAFVKDGHKFKEWNTEADGSGTTYADEAVVKNLVKKGTVTLYAQWITDGSGTGGDDSDKITIEPIPIQIYTAEAIEPTLEVKLDGTLLTADQDYEVAYSDNVKPGKATATVTLKGGYSGTKTAEFIIKNNYKAKGQWVSKHENTYVTFNWTGTPDNKLATGWDIMYRTKLIGTQNPWTGWTNLHEDGKVLSKRLYLKPNHTIEFKIKHETEATYLRSVFTTPAGGIYQSVTQCRVKVVATASGAAYRQGTKTLALKTGVNFTGDSGNIIYIKKGQTIKVTPNHVYPRANFTKYPRLYPNHAWYDVADKSVVSLSGMSSTSGMMDMAVTIKGQNVGITNIKITSCNGRGATLTIVVK